MKRNRLAGLGVGLMLASFAAMVAGGVRFSGGHRDVLTGVLVGASILVMVLAVRLSKPRDE